MFQVALRLVIYYPSVSPVEVTLYAAKLIIMFVP